MVPFYLRQRCGRCHLHGNPRAKICKINRRVVRVFGGVQVSKAPKPKNLTHEAADEVFGDLVVIRQAHRRIAFGLRDDMCELVAEPVNQVLLLQDCACVASYLSTASLLLSVA
jgi:hypothetical protein